MLKHINPPNISHCRTIECCWALVKEILCKTGQTATDIKEFYSQVKCLKKKSLKSHCNRMNERPLKEAVAGMEEQVKADLFKLSEILITSCNHLNKTNYIFVGY